MYSKLHNIQSELNPSIEVLKSFTPNQHLVSGFTSNAGGVESFDKVQLIAAEIQVSKRFNPDEELWN